MPLSHILIAVGAILVLSGIFSMFGQGGGVLYVPVLIALGMTVHDAATTSLFIILGTATSAAIIYRRGRTMDWKLALAIEPPTIALAFVGGLLSNHIDASVLKIVFAAVLLVAGFFMSRPVSEHGEASQRGWGHWHRTLGEREYTVRLPGLMPVTAGAGFIAGMIGIAGGIFKLPAMVLVGKVPMRVAIGTSSLMVGFTALAGLGGHLIGGSFQARVALPLVVAAFIGGRAGSTLSGKLKVPHLRAFFTVMLFLTAVWMLVSTLLSL
jgi:uncharacterized membrane protein YfcA